MNITQHLLIKLSEECSEISKEALKAVQFGLGNHHPDETRTNNDKLISEFNDLFAIIEMLNDRLECIENRASIENKKRKVIKFMKVSVELGLLDHRAYNEWVEDPDDKVHIDEDLESQHRDY